MSTTEPSKERKLELLNQLQEFMEMGDTPFANALIDFMFEVSEGTPEDEDDDGELDFLQDLVGQAIDHLTTIAEAIRSDE